ncbi:TPA: hypothetical protein DDW35_04810 [Candidatus Sumerlaeota bacterium]|jgi:penicillin-binding protein 2|nr:hypothetical protein [Candidatus Sumerlaeota bacterium]
MFDEKRKASQEHFAFLVRALILALVGLSVMGFIAFRIFYVTVVHGEELLERSLGNFERNQSVAAPRGNILDRRGRILATSEPRFDISISPLQTTRAEMAQTLATIAQYCPKAKLPTLDKVMGTRSPWKQTAVASKLTMDEAAPLMERQSLLPGLRIDPTFVRVYPKEYSMAAAHLTGYTSQIKPDETTKMREQGYADSDVVGRKAIEKTYEGHLKGVKGSRSVWRDARGKIIQTFEDTPGCRGSDLTLTVDIELQKAGFEILGDRIGVIVAMDPRNGETLAMVSNPTYDPNDPSATYSVPGRSEVNRVLQSHRSPGSVFKLVTATAFLLNGGDPEQRYTCQGTGENMGFKNRKYMRCDQNVAHGPTNLKRALTVSCNMYFFDVAEHLQLPNIVNTAQLFGFGAPTGINLLSRGELKGRVGLESNKYASNLADIHMLGIGQGRLLLCTPMQTTNAYATMANGGRLYRPRVLKRVQLPDGQFLRGYETPTEAGNIPWTPDQRNALLQGFIGVISEKNGTGRHGLFAPEMKVAGKTGTAERDVIRKVDSDSLLPDDAGEATTIKEHVTDAGFAGFAPYDAPEICIYVMLEAAGHGGEEAAPVARQFLEKFYALKAQYGGTF